MNEDDRHRHTKVGPSQPGDALMEDRDYERRSEVFLQILIDKHGPNGRPDIPEKLQEALNRRKAKGLI